MVIQAVKAEWEIPAQKVELGILASRDLSDSQGLEARQVLRASLDPSARKDSRDSLAARVCWSTPVFIVITSSNTSRSLLSRPFLCFIDMNSSDSCIDFTGVRHVCTLKLAV